MIAMNIEAGNVVFKVTLLQLSCVYYIIPLQG